MGLAASFETKKIEGISADCDTTASFSLFACKKNNPGIVTGLEINVL